MSVRRAGPLVLMAVAVSLGVVLLWPASRPPPRPVELAAPPAPLLAVGHPASLAANRHTSTWSNVRRPVAARIAPRASAAVVARLGIRTPERTANTVLVLGRARDRAGRVWVHARLPVLAHGASGWLPRAALGGYHRVRTRLVVNLRRRQAVLLRDGQAVLRAPVGIGVAASPTPRGRFYVRNKLAGYRSAFYGPLAFGTSARSRVLTDWPGGGFVGIHGTNRPDLIPGRVSHGCIRMRNFDIVRLGKLMPVGTPLVIS